MVTYLGEYYRVSVTRACRILTFPKSMYYYRSVKDDSEVIDKLLEPSVTKPREGHGEYYQRIRLEGHKWNKKCVRRVYLMLGQNLRRKTKKRVPMQVKEPLVLPDGPNLTWSMDFISDSLVHGRRFRTFNIIDDFNRKAIGVEAEFSFPTIDAVQVLMRAIGNTVGPKRSGWTTGPSSLRLISPDGARPKI